MRKTLNEDAVQRLIDLVQSVPGRAGLGDWVRQGRCPETDPELWFPPKGNPGKEAKAICAGCEVRAECLACAIEMDEEFGIWGGLNRAERVRLRDETRAQRDARPARGAPSERRGSGQAPRDRLDQAGQLPGRSAPGSRVFPGRSPLRSLSGFGVR